MNGDCGGDDDNDCDDDSDGDDIDDGDGDYLYFDKIREQTNLCYPSQSFLPQLDSGSMWP